MRFRFISSRSEGLSSYWNLELRLKFLSSWFGSCQFLRKRTTS
uniref:Uncharacterized protein n=1 Tax=Anguilla anguilla TaxID=7936 RepID=A0A0E9USD7_ANGAN